MNVPLATEIEQNAIETITPVDSIDEYAKLAESVGFFAEDITLYQLRACIRERGLQEYPLTAVEEFLDKRFGGSTCTRKRKGDNWVHVITHKWGWHPLRKQDLRVKDWGIGKEQTFEWAKSKKNKQFENWEYSIVVETRCVLSEPYNRLIPFPVLLTVADIAVRFPSVSFIVADQADYETTSLYPLPPGDPFLAVLGDGIPPMIIERWDEPSFR